MAENITRILFDKDATQPLILKNGNGRLVSFEQVFAVKQKEKIYCILCPVADVDGIAAQTAFVFKVDERGAVRAVKDKKVSDAIFTEYYNAINDAKEGE